MSNEKKYQNINVLNSLVGVALVAAMVSVVVFVLIESLSFFAKAAF